MGLDISAYSNIEYIENVTGDEYDSKYFFGGIPNTMFVPKIYIDKEWDFAKQASGLKDGVYRYDDALGFRAGAYSYYNRWTFAYAALQ